jgi:hypothetical protein
MRKSIQEIVSELKAAIQAGSIRNVDYKDLSEATNRGMSDRNDRVQVDMDGATDAEWRLIYGAASHVHLASYVAKLDKFPRFKEKADKLRPWIEVADLLKAAKPLIVKGRKPDPLSAEKNAEWLKTAMTCQICGKAHQEVGGKIAHHGYQRPGDGYQTASCSGARELRYEISRDAIPPVRDAMADAAERHAAMAAKYEARDVDSVKRPTSRDGKSVTIWTGPYRTITAKLVPENATSNPGDVDFDHRCGVAAAENEALARMFQREAERLQKRWNDWTPNNKGWRG